MFPFLRRALPGLLILSILGAGTVLGLDKAPPSDVPPPVTIFAAASLTDALEEIGLRYREATSRSVGFSFAASSVLARQIEAGAPADIFASADAAWMDYLAARGRIVADSRTDLLGNRLVLVVPAAAARTVDIVPGLPLAEMLGGGRLAMGEPETVPAGRYAREALTALGVWDAVAPKVAGADNVRAALALVERAETPFGIVYATDAARTDRVAVAGTFPADTHTPIAYPFALVAGRDTADAAAFLAFLSGPEAAAVFRAHGFTPRQ